MKIDLPDSWVRGFLQVNSAMALPAQSFDLHPMDVYNACFVLRRRKETRPFVRTADVAWSGNGFARAAVAKDTIGVALHNQANINDGYYGNGASWVSAAPFQR